MKHSLFDPNVLVQSHNNAALSINCNCIAKFCHLTITLLYNKKYSVANLRKLQQATLTSLEMLCQISLLLVKEI